jgi:hypothetical protein
VAAADRAVLVPSLRASRRVILLLILRLPPATNPRVPHISLVFREMWDTTALDPRAFNCCEVAIAKDYMPPSVFSALFCFPASYATF